MAFDGGVKKIRIDKRLYRYIEYELYHYEQYKKDIQIQRNRIIDGATTNDGQPKGTAIGNPTEMKGIKLVTSASIVSMERVVRAVDNALKSLGVQHDQIFKMLYISGRRDIYAMCDDMHVSYETFKRRKRELIYRVGVELGLINILT